jgi:protein-disulfide isomerase
VLDSAAMPILIAALALLLAACGTSGTTTESPGPAAGTTFESRITAVATQAGLDVAAWQACRGRANPDARIIEDMTVGVGAGVNGTPTFLVNGALVVGAQATAVFQDAIQAARARAQASGLPASTYYATTFPAVPVGTSPVSGPADALVTIVEFSDFECPFCARVQPTLRTVLSGAGSDVRIVFKHFPLSMHAHARPAAIAADCAHAQGRFWEFHDLVFSGQATLF